MSADLPSLEHGRGDKPRMCPSQDNKKMLDSRYPQYAFLGKDAGVNSGTRSGTGQYFFLGKVAAANSENGNRTGSPDTSCVYMYREQQSGIVEQLGYLIAYQVPFHVQVWMRIIQRVDISHPKNVDVGHPKQVDRYIRHACVRHEAGFHTH